MRRSILFFVALLMSGDSLAAQFKPGETVAAHRAARECFLRGELSPLALVHREVLGNRKTMRVGGPAADLRLPDTIRVKPYSIRLEEVDGKFAVSGIGGDSVTTLDGRTAGRFPATSGPFRFEKYTLNFRPSGLAQGAVLDVYDSQSAAKQRFRALEFFAEGMGYRIPAKLTPLPEPQKINLIDSHGFNRPYWIYGHLAFRVNGVDLRLEVYTPTLDATAIKRDGFMLIFADQTSGKETYSAGRYLDIEGKQSGSVEVDFNKSRNPPCAFSAAFTCPFPRKENRLPAPIRAGEKKYTGPTARPIAPG